MELIYDRILGDLIEDKNPAPFGYRWMTNQADDRVTWINDLPDDATGWAPANSRRKRLLDRIRPFQCNHDGSSVEFLSDDVRVKAIGGASDLTNPNKLQLARMPHYWTRGYTDASGYNYRMFSETYKPGYDEVKGVGYPRYKGKIVGTKLLSYSGVTPSDSMTLITANAYAQNTNPYGRCTPMYIYMNMVFLSLLDTGRWNIQQYYAGITNAGAAYSNAAPTGTCDALLTPSGIVSHEYSAGNFTPAFRWRFIEEFFGQTWNIMSGIYVVCQTGWTKHKVYMALNAAQITTNNDYSGHTLIGEIPQVSDWVLEFIPGTILPKTLGASSTTGKCDYSYAQAAGNFINTAIGGGDSGDGANAGPGCFYSIWYAGLANVHVGASFVLTELPEAAAQPPG